MIDEYGWAVTKVAPRVGDQGECFAYSTGLFLRFGQPEIIMFGLPLDDMHRMLNIIGAQMREGLRFESGRDFPDILDKYPCQFRIVDPTQYREHVGWSIWFYENLEFPVLQCFWPDKNGFFPWQAECSPRVRELQAFLFLPKLDEASRPQ